MTGKYEKLCRKCKVEKNMLNCFYRSNKSQDGFMATCKTCRKQHVQNFFKSPQRLKEHTERIQKWRFANPKKVMLMGAKVRARKCNVPFAITIDDFEIPTRCPILGIELKQNIGKISAASPSLDRIVPALGYVPGNVAVLSNRANSIKNNATYNELIAIAKWLKEVTDGKI